MTRTRGWKPTALAASPTKGGPQRRGMHRILLPSRVTASPSNRQQTARTKATGQARQAPVAACSNSSASHSSHNEARFQDVRATASAKKGHCNNPISSPQTTDSAKLEATARSHQASTAACPTSKVQRIPQRQLPLQERRATALEDEAGQATPCLEERRDHCNNLNLHAPDDGQRRFSRRQDVSIEPSEPQRVPSPQTTAQSPRGRQHEAIKSLQLQHIEANQAQSTATPVRPACSSSLRRGQPYSAKANRSKYGTKEVERSSPFSNPRRRERGCATPAIGAEQRFCPKEQEARSPQARPVIELGARGRPGRDSAAYSRRASGMHRTTNKPGARSGTGRSDDRDVVAIMRGGGEPATGVFRT